jgi:predicted RNA binding protein YcfA (HicA-like mRNA interferase family)
MTRDEIVRRAFRAFRADAEAEPPLTLRGGNAVDGYDEADPFDPARDEPTDAYIEGFAFWRLGYLDAQSWRHYLPRLIDYAFRRPDDPAMVVEALIRSLRPPDRYPPRLATLTAEQEAVVMTFLETLALGDDSGHVQADAQQALEEWWLPGARHRPRPEDVAALRTAPVTYRVVERPGYRLTLPAAFASSGARHIPEERRREVCRILQQHGFAEVRRRGSHLVMQRPTDTGSITVLALAPSARITTTSDSTAQQIA